MSHLFVFCELLYFCALLSRFYGGFYVAGFLFLMAMIYQAIDLFLLLKLHIRLRPSLCILCLQPASFGNSAQKLGGVQFFSAAFLLFALLIYAFHACRPQLEQLDLNLVLLGICVSGLGCILGCAIRRVLGIKERFLNSLYLAQLDLLNAIFHLFKKAAPFIGPATLSESAQFLSQDYPLLRITNHFLGDPLFNVRIEKKEQPHIIFVFMESFRAKNVGCLGAELPLSPNFDALAQKGMLFSNFHSTGILTSRAAIASLFGVPPAHTWWHMNRYAKIPLCGLPQALSKEGYSLALIQGGAISFDFGVEFFGAQNFQTLLGNREIRPTEQAGSSWGVFDEHLMPYAATWLEKQTTPTFLSLFTITNHHPWISPPTWQAPATAGDHPYLKTFAYSDQALGLLIQELNEKKILEKSILFIFGDHGQQTPEGNPYSAINSHLKQENIHVPLLIYAKGRIEDPKRIDTISSQVDLVPTVLDLLQCKQPHHSLGKSLLRPSTEPIFFSHPYDSVIQGCRKGDWKFLIDEHGEALYNLAQDQEEQMNLCESQSSIAQELKQATLHYTSQVHALYENQRLAPKLKPRVEQLGPLTLQLDLSDQLRLDDAELIRTARACPNLAKLSIARCRLITDVGLKELLQSCPKLEILYMDGLDEITGQEFSFGQNLTELHALGCHRFTNWNWLKQLTYLKELHLGSEKLLNEQIISIAGGLRSLRTLTLSGLTQMQDTGLKGLLQTNPCLKIIVIQDCPQITDESLEILHEISFRYAEIIDCPRLSTDALNRLTSIPNRVIRF